MARWAELRHAIFGDRKVEDAGDLVVIEAPARAEDAAIVPVAIRVAETLAPQIRELYLVIDNNPSPLAAHFVLGFFEKVFSRKQHLAADDAGRRRQDAQDRQCQCALAGARLADDPQRLTTFEMESYVVDGFDDSVVCFEVGFKISNLEEIVIWLGVSGHLYQ